MTWVRNSSRRESSKHSEVIAVRLGDWTLTRGDRTSPSGRATVLLAHGPVAAPHRGDRGRPGNRLNLMLLSNNLPWSRSLVGLQVELRLEEWLLKHQSLPMIKHRLSCQRSRVQSPKPKHSKLLIETNDPTSVSASDPSIDCAWFFFIGCSSRSRPESYWPLPWGGERGLKGFGPNLCWTGSRTDLEYPSQQKLHKRITAGHAWSYLI